MPRTLAGLSRWRARGLHGLFAVFAAASALAAGCRDAEIQPPAAGGQGGAAAPVDVASSAGNGGGGASGAPVQLPVEQPYCSPIGSPGVYSADYLSDARPAPQPAVTLDAGTTDAGRADAGADAGSVDAGGDARVEISIQITYPWGVPMTTIGPVQSLTEGVEVRNQQDGGSFRATIELSIPAALTQVSLSFRYQCGPIDEVLQIELELLPNEIKASTYGY